MATDISPQETSLDSLSGKENVEVVLDAEMQYRENEHKQETEGQRSGLKVLFLSSDTGGGHRASAESLGKQFQLIFPGTTFDLLDIMEKDGIPPYNSLVSAYKHLSAHPSQWKLIYTLTNTKASEMLYDAQMKLMCERAMRKSIKSYDPDVVVSVHPMMTNVPILACSKISNETGKHLPMFTVVTDLGSAHSLWFANGVEKMFVGSEQVKKLAQERGKVPDEKIVLVGLPIRHDFAVQAENLGDRSSPQGKAYQKLVRQELELPYYDRRTILVMGGGEGVGSLSNIVEALYVELVAQGIDALILVICGRNEKLKQSLDSRNWDDVFQRWRAAKERNGIWNSQLNFADACGDPMSTAGCIETGTVSGSIRRMLSSGSLKLSNAMSMPARQKELAEEKKAADTINEHEVSEPATHRVLKSGRSLEGQEPGKVTVIGLGFITRMAEYMVAADVLVSKAGPGTISEAAALSLPVMLTSFLPGQEEGNVDYVIDGGFGAYCSDSDPIGIAEEVCMWLLDETKLRNLSLAAKAKGAPHAARDIAKMIGESTLKWRELNEEHANPEAHK